MSKAAPVSVSPRRASVTQEPQQAITVNFPKIDSG